MVFIKIKQETPLIVLDCSKGTNDEKHFTLIIDPNTRQVTKTPPGPDLDASAAYARVCQLLDYGRPLPEETVAAWG